MGKKLIPADKLHAKWMKDPKYRKAYEELEEEFRHASAIIDIQARADVAQDQRARHRSRTKARQ